MPAADQPLFLEFGRLAAIVTQTQRVLDGNE
jgi:hypothetical protein